MMSQLAKGRRPKVTGGAIMPSDISRPEIMRQFAGTSEKQARAWLTAVTDAVAEGRAIPPLAPGSGGNRQGPATA